MNKHEEELYRQAHDLIMKGKDAKDDPARLRLILVDLQALRFEIGRIMTDYKGKAREAFREAYWDNKTIKKMSPNGAYKEAETDETVIEAKNNRDTFEVAYDVMRDFVSTNQSSLRVATEEAKNTL